MKIKVIVGTTRQNRFSEKAASFIFQEAKKIKEIDVELLDLRDYPLPFFNEAVTPSMFEISKHEYTNKVAQKWAAKIGEADGFIIVTAEYNHGYPAVLKNALDYLFKEWSRKAVGFVAYGNSGGARAVEQLRQVVIELAMTPIRTGIHIPSDIYLAVRNEEISINLELFKPLRAGRVDRVEAFFNDLIWNTRALKKSREENSKSSE